MKQNSLSGNSFATTTKARYNGAASEQELLFQSAIQTAYGFAVPPGLSALTYMVLNREITRGSKIKASEETAIWPLRAFAPSVCAFLDILQRYLLQEQQDESVDEEDGGWCNVGLMQNMVVPTISLVEEFVRTRIASARANPEVVKKALTCGLLNRQLDPLHSQAAKSLCIQLRGERTSELELLASKVRSAQQSLGSNVLAQDSTLGNIFHLLEDACKMRPAFVRWGNEFASKVGGRFCCGPVKPLHRVCEEACLFPPEAPSGDLDSRNICDALSAVVLVPSTSGMHRCLDELLLNQTEADLLAVQPFFSSNESSTQHEHALRAGWWLSWLWSWFIHRNSGQFTSGKKCLNLFCSVYLRVGENGHVCKVLLAPEWLYGIWHGGVLMSMPVSMEQYPRGSSRNRGRIQPQRKNRRKPENKSRDPKSSLHRRATAPVTSQPAIAHDANVHNKDGELEGTIPHVKLVKKEPSNDENTTPSVPKDSAGDGLSANVNNNIKSSADDQDMNGANNVGDSGTTSNGNQVSGVGGKDYQKKSIFPRIGRKTALLIQAESWDSPNPKSRPETTADYSTKTTAVADNNAESVASLANLPVIKGSILSSSASSPAVESATASAAPHILKTPLESSSAKVEKIDTKQNTTKAPKPHKTHTTKNRPGAPGSSNRRPRSRNTASKHTIQSAFLDNECDWQLLHHSAGGILQGVSGVLVSRFAAELLAATGHVDFLKKMAPIDFIASAAHDADADASLPTVQKMIDREYELMREEKTKSTVVDSKNNPDADTTKELHDLRQQVQKMQDQEDEIKQLREQLREAQEKAKEVEKLRAQLQQLKVSTQRVEGQNGEQDRLPQHKHTQVGAGVRVERSTQSRKGRRGRGRGSSKRRDATR